eukprot:759110-Hanusia_phi.AAC.1
MDATGQAGQESFRSITRSYYRGAAGALLVQPKALEVYAAHFAQDDACCAGGLIAASRGGSLCTGERVDLPGDLRQDSAQCGPSCIVPCLTAARWRRLLSTQQSRSTRRSRKESSTSPTSLSASALVSPPRTRVLGETGRGKEGAAEETGVRAILWFSRASRVGSAGLAVSDRYRY